MNMAPGFRKWRRDLKPLSAFSIEALEARELNRDRTDPEASIIGPSFGFSERDIDRACTLLAAGDRIEAGALPLKALLRYPFSLYRPSGDPYGLALRPWAQLQKVGRGRWIITHRTRVQSSTEA
jgi:hypothetical protein